MQDEAIKACRQSKSVPDFRIFYDKKATSEQIDAGLDQILDFLQQNPHRVNDELGEYCDRLFVLFIFNTGKIDFVRIEKALKFEKQILDKLIVIVSSLKIFLAPCAIIC